MIIFSKKVAVSLCFLWLTFSLAAQKITPAVIHGHADFAIGEEVRLVAYDDLLTYVPKTVARCKIAKDGSFELSFPTREIKLVQLEIRTSRAEFLIEPQKKYDFTIDMDPELFSLFSPQDYNGFLKIKNSNSDENDLNRRVNNFNYDFTTAFNERAFKIIYDHDLNAYDSVAQYLNDKYPIQYNPYDFYQSYLYYSLSELDMMYWSKDADTLFKKYLDNDHILYQNPAYMNLFNTFYDDYIFNSLKINLENVFVSINDNADYQMLFNEVGKDPFLVNERLRELVIVKSLGQLYLNHPEFNKSNIETMLMQLQANSHFTEHQPIIDNMLDLINKFGYDNPVCDVKFKESNGKDFTLKKLKGKCVLLHFFRTDCVECVREMPLLHNLADQYKDSLTLVSVCVDFDKYKLQAFLNKYPQFDWQFLHFNQQYEWLNELEMNSLPDYILLDKDGTVLQRYMPSASNGLSDVLLRRFYPEAAKDNNPMFQR